MGVTVDKPLMDHVKDRFGFDASTPTDVVQDKMLEIVLTLINVVSKIKN